MATRAESLIRQFAHQRTLEVREEEKAARAKVPDNIPIASLSPAVRQQISAYRALKDRLRKMEKSLVAQGFHQYELGQSRQTITNPKRDARRAEINKRETGRVAAINQLRDRAYVEIMGKPPAAAREIVERVQRELAKV